jgi:hypothetical protein
VSSSFGNPPGAGGAGDANVPAASQLAGLGALPGLADLPSLAGLVNPPAPNGVTGAGIPMPGTAMSAANAPGMSSDSFAALAVGAWLAGASALKIAGRRARPQGGIWSSYIKKVRWVSATVGAALVAAMFALPGAGVAYASGNGNTTGNRNISLGSGNTVTAPVNVCGNAVAAGGFANANCKGGSTSCVGNDCNQHGCQGPQCHPCQGNGCHCTGNNCHPCQGNCTPPHGCTTNCSPNTPPTGPPGNHPGGTTTTVSTGTSPSGLPTTGADLLLLGVAALGSIGVGAGAVAVARRRRNGEA